MTDGAAARWASVFAAALFACASCAEPRGPGFRPPVPPAEAPLAADVDPFIGTAADGQTFPGALVPWGMASPSPHTTLTTAADALDGVFVNAGYQHGAPTIRGFGLTHLSGVGCPDLGLPVVGATSGDSPTDVDDYATTYRNEVAYAGYYGVELGERGLVAEMTATPRTGVFRFWFPNDAPAHIVVDPARGISWFRDRGELTEWRSTTEIAGSAGFGGFCANGQGGRVYFVARLDRPADRFGLLDPGRGDPETPSGQASALWTFESAPREPVTMWVGLSWVSIDEARANLDAEQLPFDEARDAAALQWQGLLGRIEVSGGEDSDRTRFYTALYHALIHPSISNDISGTYREFNTGGVGDAGGDARHTVFSLWDTYRTVHPLLTLVYPETQLEILRSMQDMTLRGNAPPKWELVGEEVQMMVGDPAAIVFADSYVKGLTDFDADAVYEALRSAAERDEHRPGNDDYRRLGFVSMELASTVWGPVSTTLEYALADASLAELARALGRTEDVDALMERALGYRGLYDAETHTLRPRNRDGSFLTPFDPDAIEGAMPLRLGGPGYVEGTAWHYAFFAPHDMRALIALHGEEAFVDRLQWVFDSDRFVLWNEPDMGYPYLFTFVGGEAQRAQREARAAMDRYFGDGPAGLPGNDDAGALSAWFVFSAMGFYPVTPGAPEYRLGTPLFDRVTIHLSEAHHRGERFTIEAMRSSPSDILVESASLDGERLREPALSHEAITSGAVLRLEMTSDTR